jgi:hypothetical protein
MGGPMIAELSEEELGAGIGFLRGGTAINVERADQPLVEAAPPAHDAPYRPTVR